MVDNYIIFLLTWASWGVAPFSDKRHISSKIVLMKIPTLTSSDIYWPEYPEFYGNRVCADSGVLRDGDRWSLQDWIPREGAPYTEHIPILSVGCLSQPTHPQLQGWLYRSAGLGWFRYILFIFWFQVEMRYQAGTSRWPGGHLISLCNVSMHRL